MRKEARRLIKEEGVKIIIALGHAGFERDVEIAEQVEEISMIVGGDAHLLFYTPMGTYRVQLLVFHNLERLNAYHRWCPQ